MDRRDFIKLTAITGTTTALASCGHPENQIIRFVPDDEMVPGVAEWKPSVCPLCSSGCGVTVRVMEADVDVVRNGQAGVVRMGVAKKLEGNPGHPVSRGGLCARGQAAIQVTYHPDRITRPLKRTGRRGEGKYEEVTWDAAIGELLSHLDGLAKAADQKSLAFLSARRPGGRAVLTERFLAKFGAPAPIAFEFFGDDVLRRANGLSFGHEQLPTFDLGRSRYVISFGADFLGTWNSPVAHGSAYGEMRQGRPGVRGSFVQVEAHMTQTGANADEWVPAAPGTEGVLALGLAHVILKEKLRPADAAGRAGSLVAGWSSGLEDYAPERVSKTTGVPVRRIEQIARHFAERRPAMAIVGGSPLAQTNGLFTAVAVNALNALAGAINEPGGIFFTPQSAGQNSAHSSIDKLAASILAAGESPVKVLLVDGANPVFATPKAWKVREALTKVPFIASFGGFLDETSGLADLILPDHSFLESWTESAPESGSLVAVTSVAPPVMRPLYQTRAMGDVLLDIGRRLEKPLDLPWKTFDEMLKSTFASVTGKEDDALWLASLKQGGWWGDVSKGAAPAIGSSAKPAVAPMAYAEPRFDGDAQQFPFHFLPYASAAFLDGSLAHLPWLQEFPDPLTSAMWSSWVELSPQTARELGINDRDVVEITSSHGSVTAAAIVFPGLAPNIIAMPVGQGHEMFTRYATGRGENPIAILAPMTEPETGTLAWAATRVKIARVSGPDGRLVLFAGEKYENPNEGAR
jgi:anaerobic selenocysteine-containing dehydrogenase